LPGRHRLRRYAEEQLARKPGERLTVRSRTENILLKLLPHGKTTVPEVARQLGMSSRTLSRKLAEEGPSFAEILDQLRSGKLAVRYPNWGGM
jgi:AraC-like DNA-binding protein